MATPPFLGGASGVQAPAPVQAPLGGGAAGAPTDQMQQLLKMILSGAQQKPQMAQPVPAPIPGAAKPHQALVGKHTGSANLGSLISSTVQNAVHYDKQKKLAAATSDWSGLITGIQKYTTPEGKIDTKAALADPAVSNIVMDAKKMKRMAKALNQDWLNPKPDEYADGLKAAIQKHEQKQGAMQGLKQTISQMINHIKGGGQQQQPQISPQGAASIMSRAPIGTPQGATGPQAAKEYLDIAKAQQELQQKYDHVVSNDGTVWAINKNDPKDAFKVKETGTGSDVTGKTKYGADSVVSQNGIAYGVKHNGEILTPQSAGWKPEFQKVLDASARASDLKQQLRIDPIISDQIGAPPDPKDFAKGKADPGYGAALKKYGQEAEGIKNQMAGAQGAARAQAFNEYRPLQSYNPETGNVEWTFAKNAIGQTPGGAAEKLLPKQAQIADIDYSSKMMREAVNNMDKPFTPDQVAKLNMALSTGDSSMAHEIMATLATQNLTDKQQDFVIWAGNLNERAMSLRNVAGQGQGASDTRNAIRAILPGIQSGSKQMQNKQLDAFDNMTSILKKGIAGVNQGKADTNQPSSGAPKRGAVEGGYRFKGGDPADKSNWVKVQ
jgi:hypothetical protein